MTYLQAVLPLLLLVSLAAIYRGHRVLSLSTSLGILLWAWPPIAWLISGSLEWWYGPDAPAQEPQAIVVLSGTIEGRETGLDHRLARDSAVRAGYAGWLQQRKWPRVPILVTGNDQTTKYIQVQLARDGVPEELIWVESESASTADNAYNCARLLREKGVRRIALVTEAYHMLRAAASFRKQAGLEVLPAPCAFRTATFAEDMEDWVPNTTAIRKNEQAAHEWVGLAYYWLRGYI